MLQLGGHAVALGAAETQLGRGESIGDTARVLSRYADIIVLRAARHETLLAMADAATVPVVNGLTDPQPPRAAARRYHDRRGAPRVDPRPDRRLVGGRQQRRYVVGPRRRSFRFRAAPRLPAGARPDRRLLAWAAGEGGDVTLHEDAGAAAAGADCVVTDTWVSMGDEPGNRRRLMAPYRVDEALMEKAAPDALFLHCLPAHRGEEVTEAVIDGPRSAVWDQAENRLHAQKGLLLWCFDA